MATRKATLEDFFTEEDGTNTFIKAKNNKNYTPIDVVIAKNQKDFGHKKRIKP